NNNLIKKLEDHEQGKAETDYVYNHPLNYLTIESQHLSSGVIASTIYDYDENGNRTFVTLPEGNVTQYEYDDRDLQKKITRGYGDPLASTSVLDYNGNKNIKTVADGLGHATFSTYDGFDRVIDVTDAVGNRSDYNYDNNGNRLIDVYADSQ